MRKVVLEFADAMEKGLQRHEHKGGWDRETMSDLFIKLVIEVGELSTEVLQGDVKRVMAESIDVANFAMMLYDHSRKFLDFVEGKT